MTNTKLTTDASTLEAISVVNEGRLALEDQARSRDASTTVRVQDHEHNRPPSRREKRQDTTLNEIDKVRATALQNTAHHALGQLIKQPTDNVAYAEAQYTAESRHLVVTYDTDDSPMDWTYEVPWHLIKFVTIDHHTPRKYGREPTRPEPGEAEERWMSLREALCSLESMDVGVNNHFPSEVTYYGDVEPEFAFNLESDSSASAG